MLTSQEKLLLNEISKGNEKSFRKLYDSYFHQVTAYVFKISKSDEVTVEIVQDVFLKLWQNREALTYVENIKGYIYSISRNRSIDYLRKLAKEVDLIKVLAAHHQQYDNNVDQKINANDLQLIIEQALYFLSDPKKKIFQMSKIDGMSHDEIAELMHLSKSTVKNHLSETLKYLRQYFKDRPEHEYLLILLVINLLN
ncbi:RNA polymerase sigma factor [Pedobacter cryoconitis]|uniref:RNA polymerase sigma-70 factor (ECF subfamily) n=1 Tax=Pedobacter cryoconitis TaxID=188932 RepID=A0A7X0J0U3_9SPHI|nr:RNA polymerase sigma-70 factor [Pedobacter cryoconitis]MBB6498382.1 RNA polymerase sigma-70 factor (ECF subfamily) [Pedobacter cryoconitis]